MSIPPRVELRVARWPRRSEKNSPRKHRGHATSQCWCIKEGSFRGSSGKSRPRQHHPQWLPCFRGENPFRRIPGGSTEDTSDQLPRERRRTTRVPSINNRAAAAPWWRVVGVAMLQAPFEPTSASRGRGARGWVDVSLTHTPMAGSQTAPAGQAVEALHVIPHTCSPVAESTTQVVPAGHAPNSPQPD